jgi:hypothetical protein
MTANTCTAPWCLRMGNARERHSPTARIRITCGEETSKPSTVLNPWEFAHKAIYSAV